MNIYLTFGNIEIPFLTSITGIFQIAQYDARSHGDSKEMHNTMKKMLLFCSRGGIDWRVKFMWKNKW